MKKTVAQKLAELETQEDNFSAALDAGYISRQYAKKAVASVRRSMVAARKTPPSPDQLAALQQYAAIYGRRWKSELGDLWQSGRANAVLQSVRNEFGPSWLASFKLESGE